MNIFNRKTNHRHIQQFEYAIAELLKYELPQLKKALDMSKIEGIYFAYKPKGISIIHSYSEKDFAEINRNGKSSFVLNGIYIVKTSNTIIGQIIGWSNIIFFPGFLVWAFIKYMTKKKVNHN